MTRFRTPGSRWPAAVREAARSLYEETSLTVQAISDRTGMPRATIVWNAKRYGWTRPGPVAPRGKRRVPASRRRLALLGRALDLAERHMAAAEERSAAPLLAEAERELRLVTALVGLVQRHREAEAALSRRKSKEPRGPHDGDPHPAAAGAEAAPLHQRLAHHFAEFDDLEL